MNTVKKYNWPKEVFYVKGNSKNLISLLIDQGFKFIPCIKYDKNQYDHIIINNTEELEGDLEPKEFFLTEKDTSDNYKVFSSIIKGEQTVIDFLEKKESQSLPKNCTNEGQKFSTDKAPMGQILRQFPLALEAIAMRSKFGHEKYREHDQDWMNFKRVNNAEEVYLDASVRHLAEIGDEEDSIEHLKASAWNILALLQIKLEKIKKND